MTPIAAADGPAPFIVIPTRPRVLDKYCAGSTSGTMPGAAGLAELTAGRTVKTSGDCRDRVAQVLRILSRFGLGSGARRRDHLSRPIFSSIVIVASNASMRPMGLALP
jgi:hypothetical protein